MNKTDFESLSDFELYVKKMNLHPPVNTFIDKSIERIFTFLENINTRYIQSSSWLTQSLDHRVILFCTLIYIFSLSLTKSILGFAYHALILLISILLSQIKIKNLFSFNILLGIFFSFIIVLPISLNIFLDAPIIIPLLHFENDINFSIIHIPSKIGITKTGLLSMAIILVRVCLSLITINFFMKLLSFQNLLKALKYCGSPNLLNQIMTSTVSVTHIMLKNGLESHFAKKNRTLCKSQKNKNYSWTGSRLADSWNYSLSIMNDLNEAMTARGFGVGTIENNKFKYFSFKSFFVVIIFLSVCIGGHFV